LGVTFPVVGVMQVGEQAHADRYTYLPLVGIFIALAWSAWDWLGYAKDQRLRRYAFISMLVLAVCAVVTRRQTGVWVNSGVLFEHTARHTQQNASALVNWGAHLLGAEKRAAEALNVFELALRIRPDPLAWRNISQCYFDLQKYDLAHAAMAQAVAMQPSSRQMDELEEVLQDDLRKRPLANDARKLLAMIYMARKNYASAIAQLQTVIDLAPEEVNARIDQAAFMAVAGKEAEAISVLQTAIKLAPTNALAQSNLAALLAKAGRAEEAQRHHEAALKADPRNMDSRYNYALFLLRGGKLEAAKGEFEAILAKLPSHLPAMQQLAWMLATRSEFRDGPRARALAEKFMDRSTRWPSGHYDLMAAAAAADGDFSNARLFADKALQLAIEERRFVLANAIRERLRHYQANQPYSESLN
jgi:protein O-mannosyl-transferase